MDSLFHPDFMSTLVDLGHFDRDCVVKQLVDSKTADGQQVHAESDFLTGLRGRLLPLIQIRPQSQEQNVQHVQRENVRYQLVLAGYYATITPKMRVYIDGVRYEIESVEWDGSHIQTRLIVFQEVPYSHV